MTDDHVIALMLDAALPYVSGRRLHCFGLDAKAVAVLARWADAGAARSVLLSMGPHADLPTADLHLVLQAGEAAAPEPPGMERIEVLYAFELPDGLAADTAPATLKGDADWPYACLRAGLWLDAQKPKHTLGTMTMFRRGAPGF